ncbi:DUF3800 domain-containing protein [Sphingomonas koreensis]
MPLRVGSQVQALPRALTREVTNRYFLDESGHGGDLTSSAALDFSGQPVFALACVGAGEEAELTAELHRLRTKYRCGDGELKSSALGARLPDIAAELVRFLVQRQWSLFIELVDKRYFVAIHVVNHLLCGAYRLDEVDMASRVQITEFLNDADSDAVLLAYLAACRSQSIASVNAALDLLWDWLDLSDEDIARTAQVLTMYARDRSRAGGAQSEPFLPIADETISGKKVWMLPNLQCLTNIYARINRSLPRGVQGVTLVHDVQLQYGKILEDSKGLMEKLAAAGTIPAVRFADYDLRGQADLAFATAREEPCLQAADILAGCAMRFARDGLRSKGRVDATLRSAFFDILGTADPVTATGVNLVMSYGLIDRLQVPHF